MSNYLTVSLVGVAGLLSTAAAVSASTLDADTAAAWKRGTFNAAPAHDTPSVAPLDLAGSALGAPVSLVAALGTSKAVTGVVAPATITLSPGSPGPRSGLPWNSGAGCSSTPEFESWRGRANDVHVGWAPIGTWTSFLTYSSRLGDISRLPSWFSVGVPMLTEESTGQFYLCNGGSFDQNYRQFAQNLVAQGLGDSGIRIGWEANNTAYPWAIGATPDKVGAYKACWRRIANIFKEVSPNFRTEWIQSKKGKLHPSTSMYPGDDVVDHVGAHFYDRFPSSYTQADWDLWESSYVKPSAYGTGSPWGIKSWFAFAKAHKKPFTVSEWSVNNGYEQAPAATATDNPVHIRNMFQFFKANAAGIAWEGIYNCPLDDKMYQLFPVNKNPLSAAEYAARWSTGQ